MNVKKILPTKSPLGWIIAAGVILTASPTVRKKVRELAVKGTAAALDLSEKLKNKMANHKEKEKGSYHFDFSNWESSAIKQTEGPMITGTAPGSNHDQGSVHIENTLSFNQPTSENRHISGEQPKSEEKKDDELKGDH